jgi:multidrug efflux pump subunit AcrA (membrane-fusion protein)
MSTFQPSNQPSILPTGVTPIVNPVVAASNNVSNASAANTVARMTDSLLEAELLTLVMDESPEVAIRQKFRNIVLQYTRAVGVCQVQRTDSGAWEVSPEHATGRVPAASEFTRDLGQHCENVYQRGSTQIRRVSIGTDARAFFAPIRLFATRPEILLVVVTDGANLGQARKVIDQVVSAFSLWLKGLVSRQSDWKLASLAALVEIVSRVESAGTLQEAGITLVNDLAKQLGCPKIAVGLEQQGKVTLQAVSGMTPDELSSTLRNFTEQVVSESMIRREPGVWPPIQDDTNSHLLLAHKQLARTLQVESVASQPLKTLDDRIIGSLVFMGPRELTQADRFSRFLNASAPRLASALDVARRAQPSRWTQRYRRFLARVSADKRKTALVIAASIALILCLPVPYQVRCRCTAEPTLRRFAVAPYEGLVERGFVKAGDSVSQGQLLAQMDGRSIRWELASIKAEREQALRRREVKLAAKEVSEAILAELESKRLAAREELLMHQLQQLEVRSSLDGVVLSGSLERAEAASVEMGQVLFEIGPLKPLRLEIAIPADEIPQVQVGHTATIWISGQEGKPIRGKVERIQPRSETRDSKNVFIAEVMFPNDDLRLSPGMEGNVRIQCNSHPLAWNLFHKPWNYVRSQLTLW